MALPIEQGGWDQSQLFNQLSSGSAAGNITTAASVLAYKDMVEKLLEKNQRIHKVSILITSTFSLVAALIVIAVVLLDARTLQQHKAPGKPRKSISLWSCIHKAELMPLAIALASVVQSCVFLGVQSKSLNLIWVTGCARTAQLIWPAIWIVGFTVSAFSMELTFRSLQSVRFEPRSKRHLLSSVLLIGLLLSATLITARVVRSEDVCYGDLVWWSIHFVQPSIALGAGIILVNLVTGLVLTLQLLKTVEMCRDERIAASRVIYSLVINIMLLSLVLPFFILYALGTLNREISAMADSVITLNGLLHGVVHLFLRTNGETLAIRPRDTPWSERRPLRLFGPNDLNIHDFISTPIVRNRDADRTMLYTGLAQKFRCHNGDEVQPRQQFISIHPDVPPPRFSMLTDSRQSTLHASRYSIFPPKKNKTQLLTKDLLEKLPTENLNRNENIDLDKELSVAGNLDSADVLTAPKPLFLGQERRNSDARSEIVEIALRLSKAPSDADSVYIHEPVSASRPVELSRSPSLLSPDKYVPAARLAEAARARSRSLGNIRQQANVVELSKPIITAKIIGIPRNPVQFEKMNGLMVTEEELSSEISSATSARDKQLPPIPAQEQYSRDANLNSVTPTSRRSIVTPKEQIMPPVPDWRQSTRPVVLASKKLPTAAQSTNPKHNSWAQDERI